MKLSASSGKILANFTDPFPAGTDYFAATPHGLFFPVVAYANKTLRADDEILSLPVGAKSAVAVVSAITGKVTRVLSASPYGFPTGKDAARATWSITNFAVADLSDVWFDLPYSATMVSISPTKETPSSRLTVGHGNALDNGPTSLSADGKYLLVSTLQVSMSTRHLL